MFFSLWIYILCLNSKLQKKKKNLKNIYGKGGSISYREVVTMIINIAMEGFGTIHHRLEDAVGGLQEIDLLDGFIHRGLHFRGLKKHSIPWF